MNSEIKKFKSEYEDLICCEYGRKYKDQEQNKACSVFERIIYGDGDYQDIYRYPPYLIYPSIKTLVHILDNILIKAMEDEEFYLKSYYEMMGLLDFEKKDLKGKDRGQKLASELCQKTIQKIIEFLEWEFDNMVKEEDYITKQNKEAGYIYPEGKVYENDVYPTKQDIQRMITFWKSKL